MRSASGHRRPRRARARHAIGTGLGWLRSSAFVHWKDLRAVSVAALLTSVPIAFVGAALERGLTIDPEGRSAGIVALVATVIFADVVFVMLGNTFLSGVLGNYLLALGPERQDPSLRAMAHAVREAARQVRLWRLVRLDLYVTGLTVLGLLLFVIPGLVVGVLLALSGPVLSLEGLRPRQAMRRSVQIVRRRPVAMATALVVPSVIWGGLASQLDLTALGTGVDLLISGLVYSPFVSLVRLIAARQLIAEHAEVASRAIPAGSSAHSG